MIKEKTTRRDILKKASFAIPTIVTLSLAETQVKASGIRVKGNNGWGNGDQSAPGGSLPNNSAENDLDESPTAD